MRPDLFPIITDAHWRTRLAAARERRAGAAERRLLAIQQYKQMTNIHDAKLLLVDAGVRYWEDATVNGKDDEDGTLIPHRCGDRWQITIELATGQIKYWPTGTTADVHYKVCDAGEYWLADEAGKRLFKWSGSYVPDAFLCVGDRGYGDYIIFQVSADGKIQGWTLPLLDSTEWEATP